MTTHDSENEAASISTGIEMEAITKISDGDSLDRIDGDDFQNGLGASPPSDQGEVFMKKYVVSRLMDVALLMANASQLRVVVSSHNRDFFFGALLCFITMSIVLQILFVLVMIWKQRLEDKRDQENAESISEYKTLKGKIRNLETLSSVFMTFIMVANVLIVGFGLEDNSRHERHGPLVYTGQ